MPKTFGTLFPRICDFQNLLTAFKLASRGKREMSDVLKFGAALEENLFTLQHELLAHTWTPRPFRRFMIREPKAREIAAPAFRDRVVHHALVAVINPLLDGKMISASFACRVGLGTHAAVAKAREYIRECHAKYGEFFILKGDVSRYFYSIDHTTLKGIFRRTIRCKDTLWLMDRIVDNDGSTDVGIPIGALTSQLFANVYLDQMDHYVKEVLKEQYYLRYMDDFVFMHPSKDRLHELKDIAEDYLNTRLKLRLNPKTSIFPQAHGLDFCGYRIWATHTLPRKRNVYRMRRRLRRMAGLYASGKISRETVESVLFSWFGYMQHCDSYQTMSKFLGKFALERG
ncbi:MAG: reverse transcriptase/maturase family protein [Synergistaceae bacterium]|nr:reverse transcriptase/maturase family protein [Synergistaceae bacterium]